MSETPDLQQIAAALAQVARQLGDVVTAERMANPRHVYTLPEVAATTGWALTTLVEDCRLGRLPHVIKGKAYGLTAKQLDAAIEMYTVHGSVEKRIAAV